MGKGIAGSILVGVLSIVGNAAQSVNAGSSFRTTDSPLSFYNTEYPGAVGCETDASEDEVTRFFGQQCRYRTWDLYVRCHLEQLSCRRSCQAYVTNIKEGATDFRYCSCDPLCFVFDDCCYDVSTYCQESIDTYQAIYSHWGTLNIPCEDEYPIISTCPKNESRAYPGIEDARDPVLTDIKTGLTFRNRQIYKCFYGKDPTVQEVVAWDKSIESDSNLQLSVLSRFFEYGEILPALKESIDNKPPATPSLRARQCFSGVTKLLCHTEENRSGESCPEDEHICVRRVDRLCDLVSEGLDQTILPSTTAISFGPTSVTRSTNAQNNDGIAGRPGRCIIQYMSMDLRSPIDKRFTILMEFTGVDAETVSLSNINNAFDTQWAGLELGDSIVEDDNSNDDDDESNNENGLVQYELFLLCAEGFVSNGDSCDKPRLLTFQIYVAECSPRLVSALTHLISSLSAEFEGNLTLGNGFSTKSTVSPHCTVMTSVDIFTYTLTYNGTRLPFTDLLVQILNRYDETPQLGTFQMVACLVMNRHSDQLYLCDQITTVSKLPCHVIEHYRTSSPKSHVARWEKTLVFLKGLIPTRNSSRQIGGFCGIFWGLFILCLVVNDQNRR